MQFTLRGKFTLLQLALLVILTIVTSLITSWEMQKYYKQRLFNEVNQQLLEIQYLLTETGLGLNDDRFDVTNLQGFARAAGFRLTLVDSMGRVRFDSEIHPDSLARLVNHLSRPEIQMALARGLGYNTRVSTTIGEPLFYAALKIESVYPGRGASRFIRYIRIALPGAEIDRAMNKVRWKVFGAGAIALLIMGMLSFWAAQRLTFPLQELAVTAERVKAGDLEAHFEHRSQDELGKLADLLNEMLSKLRADLIQLRKLEKMRSQFLGNVSHELRTPIFAVQGYLETMMNGKITDAKVKKEFVAKAYHQAVRLNNLLTDLIDISRIESGEMKMSFKHFDLYQWLSSLVEDMQAKAEGIQVRLNLVPAEPVAPILVLGDQERLTQVIVNLVENAVKYNTTNGHVQVGYNQIGQEVELYVADSGRGIEAEHLDRIFERFYRVDKERSRSVGGTGLGLAIVKHIVEAHGSQVRVKSAVGKGSHFSFRLGCGIH